MNLIAASFVHSLKTFKVCKSFKENENKRLLNGIVSYAEVFIDLKMAVIHNGKVCTNIQNQHILINECPTKKLKLLSRNYASSLVDQLILNRVESTNMFVVQPKHDSYKHKSQIYFVSVNTKENALSKVASNDFQRFNVM